MTYLLLSFAILALLVLLRVVFCWGVAQGELDEFLRQRPERWGNEHPQAEWRSEVENDDKAL